MVDCPIQDDKDRSSVLNAIGIYIAAASFYFVVAFGADVVNRYVQVKPWYPTRYISLNAISLTALAIAIKIPTDLTTSMTKQEQFSKLTGTILVCTAMANSMPSLGGMDDASTIISNVAALFVTVVTLVVDLGIQIRTNIIREFWREEIAVMVIMSLQLLFLVSTAVVVPTTKELMERQFKTKHTRLSKENMLAEDKEGEKYVSKIKENLIKYWLMAHSSNPQYIVARSRTCIASCSLCFVTMIVMIEAIVRIFNDKFDCSTKKRQRTYDWPIVSTIIYIQMLAIILGTIGPASRCIWWSEVVFKNCSFRMNWKDSIKNIIINNDCFKVKDYWVSRLVKWKDAPIRVNFKGILIRKFIRFFKCCILTLLVKQQMAVVTISKLICALSVVPMLLLHKILHVILHLYLFLQATIGIVIYLKIIKHLTMLIYLSPYFLVFLMRAYLVRLTTKFQLDRLRIISEHQHSINSDFVLHLEGETGLVRFITEDSLNNGRISDKKKKKKKKKEEKEKQKNAKLIQLIENHSTFKNGFQFVTGFLADTKSSSHPDLLRCSWALPLVTLSCIAVTLPGVDRKEAKLLREGVNRGFKYVKLIEKCFDDRLLINMREAAEFVWLGIDLDSRWFDFDLRTFLRSEDKDAREVVEDLGRIATNHILEFKNRAEGDAWNKPYEWPPMVLAADCMQSVCWTILQSYDQYGTNMTLFQWLQTTISDTLGACLTNFPEVMHMECSQKSIELREESVWNAANLFIKSENLLVLLYDPVVASRFPERKKNIEEWQGRDATGVADIPDMEAQLRPEPSSATPLQLDGIVVEVDAVSGRDPVV